MIIRIILGAIMLAVLMFGAIEIRAWSTQPDLISPKQRRIRGLGFVFLLLSLGLWLNGSFMQAPPTHQKPLTRAAKVAAITWIGYWGITFLTLVPIIPLALLDTRENLRRASEQRRNLLQEVLSPSGQGRQNRTVVGVEAADRRCVGHALANRLGADEARDPGGWGLYSLPEDALEDGIGHDRRRGGRPGVGPQFCPSKACTIRSNEASREMPDLIPRSSSCTSYALAYVYPSAR